MQAHASGEALCFVLHLVAVQNPVGILLVIGQLPYAIEETILRTVLVLIVAHVLGKRPGVERIHCTGAATSP